MHARVQKKGQERLMSKDVRFAPKEEQCPHHEAGTFADQHQQRRLAKIDPVKAERDGKDIADKGKPGQQGEPMPPYRSTLLLCLISVSCLTACIFRSTPICRAIRANRRSVRRASCPMWRLRRRTKRFPPAASIATSCTSELNGTTVAATKEPRKRPK